MMAAPPSETGQASKNRSGSATYGIVGHCLRRIEDAFHRYLLLEMGPLIVEGGVLILDADHGEMPLGDAVLLHVEAGEHGGVGRQGHPVDVLGERMGQSGHEVGCLEVVHLTHPLDAGHEDDIVHPGSDRLEPGLDGSGSRGGAVLDGGGTGRQQAQAVGYRASKRRLMIDPGGTHVGHIELVDLGDTGVLERHHRGVRCDLHERILEAGEGGDPDPGYVDVTHPELPSPSPSVAG